MQTTMRFLATLAVLALASTDAAKTQAPITNSSMSLGDGTTVNTNSTTTVFLGTEYNPDKCVLQFASLECTLGEKSDCGELNGYPLECVKLGKQNGKEKVACQCRANETDVCQSSTSPTKGGVMQFGDCSGGKQCVDSYGHVPSKLELRICAEKLHCVKEINTTASVPAEICHTCRSCIAQNDAAGAKLSDKRRFDCTKICPTEILDSLAKRNKEGVGIADELSSGEESGSGESSEEGSDSGSSDPATATGSASKATDAKSAALSLQGVSATTFVATIVFSALSAVLVL